MKETFTHKLEVNVNYFATNDLEENVRQRNMCKLIAQIMKEELKKPEYKIMFDKVLLKAYENIKINYIPQ